MKEIEKEMPKQEMSMPSAQTTQPFSYTSPLFGTITGAGAGAGVTTPQTNVQPQLTNQQIIDIRGY